MSDDDVEMVDVIDTPSGSEESPAAVPSEDPSPSNELDIERENELDAATRIDRLCSLDEQIASILAKGSAIVEAIAQGKLAGDAAGKKERFKSAIIEYNQLVEEVNGKLRHEVKLVHEASHSKLLPLYIPVQASSLGREKENMLLTSLEKALH